MNDLPNTRMTFYMLRTFARKIAVCTLAAGLSMGLSGCSSMGSLFGSDSAKLGDENVEPPETIYQKADTALSSGSYEEAAKQFEEVDRQHPYSPLARKAIVMSAFSHYKRGEYAQAIAGGQRYVTLHPGTKESALAQHIIASSYFDQINGPRNDQTITQKALKEMEILVRRYPDSRYTAKAKNRILITKDVLAASEMNVGRYYQKRKNYLAAINRFKTVIQKYQTTNHVREALLRATESYLSLGVVPEAESAAAVLGHNFPTSKWYKQAYALLQANGHSPKVHTGSWISNTWQTSVAPKNAG